MAGYATHGLALSVAAFGVATMNLDYLDLGIALERCVGQVMVGVAAGKNYLDSLVIAMKGGKQSERDNFGKLKELGKEFDKTLEEVKDAIHEAKRRGEHKGKPQLSDDEIREILEELL